MGSLNGERISLGQERGPDVELVAYGDDAYAHYETPAGYPVLYDAKRGLFCYALVHEGTFVSSGVPATGAPPPGAVLHAQEAPEVRLAKAAAKLTRRSPPPDDTPARGNADPSDTRLSGQAGLQGNPLSPGRRRGPDGGGVEGE